MQFTQFSDDIGYPPRQGFPRLTEVLNRNRLEMGTLESQDIDFKYEDADSHLVEIAELYSYTEEVEFPLNRKAFQDLMEEYGICGKWTKMNEVERHTVVMRLLDQVELCQRHLRLKGLRAIMYLVQGVFGECECEEEQQYWERQNIFLLYENGVFETFLELLNMEIDNSSATTSALRKPAVSLVDSVDLRLILSVLYTTTEVLRCSDNSDTDEMKRLREGFKADLGQPSCGEDLVAFTLLGMITRFCSGSTPHFPIKKVLLLLWKVLLVSLGGTDDLRTLKSKFRMEAGLPPVKEDTVEVTRLMRAASPPASASDLIEAQLEKRSSRPLRAALMKQNSMDDSVAFQDIDRDDCSDEELREMKDHQLENNETDEDRGDQDPDVLCGPADLDEESDECRPPMGTPRPSTPVPSSSGVMSSPPPPVNHRNKGLPWTPKIRQKDIDSFLNYTRKKFVGFPLEDDLSSLAGLPEPIHEGLSVLKQHVYVSLAEVQIKREEEIENNPFSKPEREIPQTNAEILYQAMLPNLNQYMIALLKLLLAAAPTSMAKMDSINIMSDVLPEEMPVTVSQSMKLGIDVNRHKEIIVKAVSGILLLLLKHFKINHVYQFEYLSQHMIFSNCIPLVLKFFNQNIMSYVQAKNSISIIDFPSCVLGEQPDLTSETLSSIQEIGDNQQFCWRNMFSCINLARILNKLTKWKQSRIMMLVVFKSSPILKRTLKVRHAMLQLYILKLLKMQTKYLGRQWRKNNMKAMSAIYQKVRHRLNDDWAYGNDLDARPWDFQAEECALRSAVDQFNNRRYIRGGWNLTKATENDSANARNGCSCFSYEPVDNCILSVLGTDVELTEEFKKNYDVWLYQEVFQANVDWDQLLTQGYL